jgi:hypothetical protein
MTVEHTLASGYDIDVECPFIHPMADKFYETKGWRHLENLNIRRTSHNLLRIREEQDTMGRLNVTLGHAVSEHGRPQYVNDLVGLYIKVEDRGI